jgi:hypothetical protein
VTRAWILLDWAAVFDLACGFNAATLNGPESIQVTRTTSVKLLQDPAAKDQQRLEEAL